MPTMIDASLKHYIEDAVLPMYDDFDPAHRRDHVDMVIEQSLAIARHYDVDENMVYAIIRDEPLLRSKFDTIYNRLTNQ